MKSFRDKVRTSSWEVLIVRALWSVKTHHICALVPEAAPEAQDDDGTVELYEVNVARDADLAILGRVTKHAAQLDARLLQCLVHVILGQDERVGGRRANLQSWWGVARCDTTRKTGAERSMDTMLHRPECSRGWQERTWNEACHLGEGWSSECAVCPQGGAVSLDCCKEVNEGGAEIQESVGNGVSSERSGVFRKFLDSGCELQIKFKFGSNRSLR